MKLAIIALACVTACAAQDFTQRGYLESGLFLFPQSAPNDSGNYVGDELFRYEASYKITPGLILNGSFDAGIDTHRQIDRAAHLDWQDRGLARPAFSLRRLSLVYTKGKFTAEIGKQFIRWGKADILNPTDHFAPKDFLNVTESDFLAIPAMRLTYDTGSDSFDFVWQARFTPSRTPLLDQRWTVVPPSAQPYALIDGGSEFPGRSSFGARWNHIGDGYECSFDYYDGYDNLPLFRVLPDTAAMSVLLQRFYPELRSYGADAAVPLRWFTVKGEAAYYGSSTKEADEYVLYVVQIERQIKELSLVGGYAGQAVTNQRGVLNFSPERGFSDSFLGRADYTIGPTRNATLETIVRLRGSLLRGEYSQTFGQHWRGTAGYAWIRGDESDFLGEYRLNSYGFLSLRYSF